jgi:uncharacterized protein (DUF2141 family)
MFLLAALLATAVPQATVRVEINNVDHAGGQLLVVLFDQAEGFPDKRERAYASVVVPATQGTTVAEFPNVPFGTWAAFAVHDEDADYTCDLKWPIPMPKEPVGATRSAKGLFGPPRFQDAAFPVAGPTTEKIVLVRL